MRGGLVTLVQNQVGDAREKGLGNVRKVNIGSKGWGFTGYW